MHFSTVTLFSSILLATRAVAIVPRSPFLQLLSNRQTTDACTPSCSTFDSALNTCTTTTCLCTATVANGLNSCVNCYYSEVPTTDVLDAANKLINDYKTSCAGISLPAISVKTSGGGASTAVVPVVTTATAKAATTTNTPIVVTSVAAATTVAAPKVTVTAAVSTGDATTTSSSSSSSGGGNVIPGLTSGSTLVQRQALIVPAAVVLGGFLALM